MSRMAANIIAAQVIMKPDCVLGLATGSTPVGTYEELVRRYDKGELDFSTVTSINLDEYKGLSPENDQSYRYFMNTHLTQSTIDANSRFFASMDEVPKQAYTMGIGTIMQAKKVLVVVSGKAKAQIVKDAFFGPCTPQVPASILQLHSDVILVGDEEALSLIP